MQKKEAAGSRSPNGLVEKVFANLPYQAFTKIATGPEYATAKLSLRFGLTFETARAVSQLSGLGGSE